MLNIPIGWLENLYFFPSIKYSFIKPKDCKSGKLKDSYVLAQNGKVVLKQVSKDGSIGPVCIK